MLKMLRKEGSYIKKIIIKKGKYIESIGAKLNMRHKSVIFVVWKS